MKKRLRFLTVMIMFFLIIGLVSCQREKEVFITGIYYNDSNDLVVEYSDGRKVDVTTTEFIVSAEIIDGELIVTLSNDETSNLGRVIGFDGSNGKDGNEVILQTSETHIQWKYQHETQWNDLIPLSLLKGDKGDQGVPGEDGKEVEFSTNTTHIRWRYVGDTTWNNLIELELLKGVAGSKGEDGIDGREILFNLSSTHLEWKYEGETNWKQLLDLSLLIGINGEDGRSAYEIYLENNPGYSGNEQKWIDDLVNGNLAEKKVYKVTYYMISENSTVEKIVEDVNYGELAPYKHIERDNYYLEGWYYFDYTQGEFEWNFAGHVVTKNMTLYPKWRPLYQPVYTKADFLDIHNNLSGNYKLMNDIDLEDEEWIPFGSSNNIFIGNIDGQGYTISNFKITNLDNIPYHTGYSLGLIGYAGARIHYGDISFDFGFSVVNLNIDNFVIDIDTTTNSNKYFNVGLVVGRSSRDLLIKDVNVTNSSISIINEVEAQKTFYVGGVAGVIDVFSYSIDNAHFENVSIEADISIENAQYTYVGGLIGISYGDVIGFNFYHQGDINMLNGGAARVGRLIGYVRSTITNLYGGISKGDIYVYANGSTYLSNTIGGHYYNELFARLHQWNYLGEITYDKDSESINVYLI